MKKTVSNSKILLLGCLIVLFFFFSNQSKASHMAGAEITYVCEGAGKYSIYVKVYRDCNGIQVSQSPILVKSGTTIINLTNQTKISARDVTGISDRCPIQSRCSGSFQYGFQEHVWKATVDLSAYTNLCEWTISWEQAARIGSITTGPANQNFYLESKLNKCLDNCNSSPVMLSSPSFLACHNQEYSFSLITLDTVDKDRLSYHLVPAMQYVGQTATYSNGFNPLEPVTYSGDPNPNLPPPLGFRLDSVTGLLTFIPTKLNEIAVIVIEVREWREINGVLTQIGSVIREFNLFVTACPNNSVPDFKGYDPDFFESNNEYACSDNNMCFTIETTDSNMGDSTFLEIIHNIPGAVDAVVQDSNRARGIFCWKPTVQDVRDEPYQVFVKVWDDNCPFRGVRIRVYNIYVGLDIHATIEVDTTACGDIVLKATPADIYPSHVTYKWFATKDGKTKVVSSQAEDTVKLESGSHKIALEMSSGISCTRLYKDSITVNNVVIVDLGRDTTYCRDTTLVLDAGPGYSSYNWNVGGNGQTTTVKGSGVYSVEVEDNRGCKASDEKIINMWALPDSSFSIQDLTLRNFIFSATDTSGVSYAWDFGDGNTADTNPAAWQYAVEDSYTVTLTVTDSITGCTNTSSQQLLITGIQQLQESGIYAKLYPNPAGDELSLDLELQESGEVSLSVIDINGRTVIGEEKHNCSSGEFKKSLDVSTLASGFYAVKIKVNGEAPVLVKFVKR